MKTLSRFFIGLISTIILAFPSPVLAQSASGSATPSPTPATQPVSGAVETTLAMLIAGGLFMVFGLIAARRAQSPA